MWANLRPQLVEDESANMKQARLKIGYVKVAASIVCLAGFTNCSSSAADGQSTADNSSVSLESKCIKMCQHLLAKPLSGCSKLLPTDPGDVDECPTECYRHVTSREPGKPPEATEAELDCATAAQDCPTWKACGDLL